MNTAPRALFCILVALTACAFGANYLNIQRPAYNPLVHLPNCVAFGSMSQLKFEWKFTGSPLNTLEFRFSAPGEKGFVGLGLQEGARRQIIAGQPVADLPCAQALYQNSLAFDFEGNAFDSFPELPASAALLDGQTAKVYGMRNLTTSGKHFLSDGKTLATNVTILWSYRLASLFGSSCADVDALPGSNFKEEVTFEIILGNGATDWQTAPGGTCDQYVGPITSHDGGRMLYPGQGWLGGEVQQTRRVVVLFIGGDLLLHSGKRDPIYDQTNGFVLGGEPSGNGKCQASLAVVYARWGGFTDSIGGIARYLVTAGTPRRPRKFLDRYDAGIATSIAVPAFAALVKNDTLVIEVWAENTAGKITKASSRHIRVLNEAAPVHGTLKHMPTQTQFQQSPNSLSAKWDGWVQEDYSTYNEGTGLWTFNGFEYAIGVKGQAVDGVVGWTHTNLFSMTLGGMSLGNGNTYTISVRSTNCAGGYTTLTTSGVTIDSSAPTRGVAFIGNVSGVHKKKHMHTAPFSANWRLFRDTVSSIASYAWAVGLAPRAPVGADLLDTSITLMNYVSVGKATSAVTYALRDTFQSRVGQSVYVYVKATDVVGNYIVAVSNATVITSL